MTMKNKFERNKLVLKYVKNEVKKGHFPSYEELKKKFNLSRYRTTLKDIYPPLGISLLELPIKRPQNSIEELRNELINYVKKEVQKGHYPSRRFLQKRFNLRFESGLFLSIEDLYQKAGLKYVQKNSQELKNRKAKMLTEIGISLLPKLNLRLVKSRSVHQKGVDIIAKSKDNKTIGIELKAHNKNEPIKERNIQQLKRFLEKERLDKIILITTTSKFESKISKMENLDILAYNKLKTLCDKTQLDKMRFIRNESIHQETKEKDIKKQLLIDYTKKKLPQGKDISHIGISKDLHLHVFTYFDSINDVYYETGFLPPLSKIKGRRAKKRGKYFDKVLNQISDYLRREVSKGYYPSGQDVGEKFGVSHIWNIITMKELYHSLGLPAYHERKHRGFKRKPSLQ